MNYKCLHPTEPVWCLPHLTPGIPTPSSIPKQNLSPASVSLLAERQVHPSQAIPSSVGCRGQGRGARGTAGNPGLLGFPAQGAGSVSASKGAGAAMTQTQLSSAFQLLRLFVCTFILLGIWRKRKYFNRQGSVSTCFILSISRQT